MALAFLTKINAATGKAFSDGMPSSRCANARIYRAFDGKINPSPFFAFFFLSHFPPRNSGIVIVMGADPIVIRTVQARQPPEEIVHSR